MNTPNQNEKTADTAKVSSVQKQQQGQSSPSTSPAQQQGDSHSNDQADVKKTKDGAAPSVRRSPPCQA
jgi:hypothetical protein